MQTTSAALRNALQYGYTLKAVPKVTFEWNQNRYAGILKVDNNPPNELVSDEVENFPIESIVEPQRPTKGIIKARTSPAKYQFSPGPWRRRVSTLGDEGFTAEDYTDTPGQTRYYTVGPDAPYKYWTSPRPSTTSNNGQGYTFPSGYEVQPYVLYKTMARVNKIVIGLESSAARPTDYDIQITQDSGRSWSTIASDVTPNADGQVIIYRQLGGAWASTKNMSSVTNINGVRLVVRGMSDSGVFFNLIEISARLELDMSPYVISYNKSMEMSEANFLTPLGRASANTASIVMSNLDGLFNNENPLSIFYRLVDKNIKVTCDLEYDLTDSNGTKESVREFTMWVDQWSGESDLEITAECKDSSKFLMEEKVPQTLLQNITVGEAVWRLCDVVGFTNYTYDRKDTDPASTLEYFWTEDEDTVWGAFQSLAEATQTAIYFDEFDGLRVKSREAAYDLAKTPSWALEATDNGNKLPDVVSANILADYEANIVNINYKTTKVSDDNKGLPAMQVLWQPEDSFVLRASRLTQRLPANEMTLKINPKDAAVWPYSGLMNIEGELIKYDGKQYAYYTKNGTLTRAWVYTHEEKLNIDKVLTDENQAFKSTWTGHFKVKERGVYWSSPREHLVDINNWRGRYTSRNVAGTTPGQQGITYKPLESVMNVKSPANPGADSMYVVTRGLEQDAAYRRYGARIRIPNVGSHRGACGIVIMAGPNESGYYIELIRSRTLDENAGAMRNFIHEVGFFVRHSNGAQMRIAGKGARAEIVGDAWYDLDVDLYIDAAGAHNIIVYLNGIVMQRIRLTAGRVARSGRFGVYQRGKGHADFEYFFAHAGGEEYRTDEVSQFDKIRGGFVSGQWDREYVYSTRNATRKIGNNSVSYKQKYNQYFFDEFGPIVHEIREMDVQFEKFPVLHSRLYISNGTQVLCPEYSGTPFSAKFMLANTSRQNAVANGEDTLLYGADNSVTQRMMIYGRLIYQEEGQMLTVKNDKGKEVNPIQDDDSIRRRGKVEIDIDSKWIQSKAEAEELGNWILKHWGGGNDEVEVEAFGNPLLQLGDIVTLDYPDKNMYRNTHRYFIVAITNAFDTGLVTSLTLRRAKV